AHFPHPAASPPTSPASGEVKELESGLPFFLAICSRSSPHPAASPPPPPASGGVNFPSFGWNRFRRSPIVPVPYSLARTSLAVAHTPRAATGPLDSRSASRRAS